MEKIQSGVERIFFKGESSGWSKWLTYMIVNVVLMLCIFFLFLMGVAYSWTGSIYPVWEGYQLNFLGENQIPFIPESAIIYVFIFYTAVSDFPHTPEGITQDAAT